MAFVERTMSASKSPLQYLEKTEAARGTLDPTSLLSESHRSYLLERHGTLDLDPIPSIDPADPYNWPLWKVCVCVHIHREEIMLTKCRK